MFRSKPIDKKISNSFGYTLVELMLTIGITCILATIATGGFVNPFKMPNGAEEIETLRMAISNMRNQSIMMSQCTTITVDPTANTLTTIVYTTCSAPPSNPIKTVTYQFSSIALAAFNVGTTVEFVPGGGTTAGTVAVMKFTAGGTGQGGVYSFTLNILPAIGNIRIF